MRILIIEDEFNLADVISSRLNKLDGLNNGANDYITKPFHIDELVARVNIQLRNSDTNISKDYIEAGDVRLNVKTTSLICLTTNETIDIMCKEFQILEYLMQNKGQTISREKLYEKVKKVSACLLSYYI